MYEIKYIIPWFKKKKDVFWCSKHNGTNWDLWRRGNSLPTSAFTNPPSHIISIAPPYQFFISSCFPIHPLQLLQPPMAIRNNAVYQNCFLTHPSLYNT